MGKATRCRRSRRQRESRKLPMGWQLARAIALDTAQRCELERLHERDEVLSFLRRELEAELGFVVLHDVLERRGDAVVEVRCARRDTSQRRRLEFVYVAPQAGAQRAARIGRDALL